MDSFGSDLSETESEGSTVTSVLLGYASTEPTADTISHLGGYAVRLCVSLKSLHLLTST